MFNINNNHNLAPRVRLLNVFVNVLRRAEQRKFHVKFSMKTLREKGGKPAEVAGWVVVCLFAIRIYDHNMQ